MRILDVVLLEDKQPIFAIGDSHAKAIGDSGKFRVYAANGRSAFSAENESAVEQVPNGSVVVLSAGTNDMNNQNKTSVIQRIEKLLFDLINKKKCTVWFVLPAATDAPAFVGYKDMLRNELAKQLPDDFPTLHLLDLGTLSIKTGDGIHAPMSWYQTAAQRVASTAKEVAKPTAPQSGQEVKSDDPLGDFIAKKEKEKAEKPAEQPSKEEPKPADTAPTIPTPTGRYGPAVQKLQVALMILGYDVGPDKDDAKYGKNTAAAVKKFQEDHKLPITGKPDEATMIAINAAIAEKHKQRKPSSPDRNVTPSPADKPGQSGKVPPGTKPTGSAAEMSEYLKSKGMDDKHRAGILINIEAESNFDVGNTTGDKGMSWGLFQWQNYKNLKTGKEDRRRDRMVQAVPDWKSNWKGQIDYALSEPEGRTYLNRSFGTAGEAAYWWCYYFERPRNKAAESQRRSEQAKKYL